MPQGVTDAIELVVGLACIRAAVASWARIRWLAVLLVIAGAAAIFHAIASLAS